MASPTQWTWVWVNSRRWWRTGKPGVLQCMGSQSQTCLSDWTAFHRLKGAAHAFSPSPGLSDWVHMWPAVPTTFWKFIQGGGLIAGLCCTPGPSVFLFPVSWSHFTSIFFLNLSFSPYFLAFFISPLFCCFLCVFLHLVSQFSILICYFLPTVCFKFIFLFFF